MKWTRKWYQFNPQWNYVKEWAYVPMMGGEYKRIFRFTINRAEEVINELCKKVPEPKDIKIIECNCK